MGGQWICCYSSRAAARAALKVGKTSVQEQGLVRGPQRPGLSEREQTPERSCSWREAERQKGLSGVFLVSPPDLALQMAAGSSRQVAGWCTSTLSASSLGATAERGLTLPLVKSAVANELPRGAVSLGFTARPNCNWLLAQEPSQTSRAARCALGRLEERFVAEGGDAGGSIMCVQWAGICPRPSQLCVTDGRSEPCLAFMGSVGRVRGSGSVSLGENGTCQAFGSFATSSGRCSGICARNQAGW